MFKQFFVSATALTLLAVSPGAHAADELSTLKSQLKSLLNRIDQLEKKQANQEAVVVEREAKLARKESELEQKVQQIDAQSQQIKLAENSTVKNGSMPGSFLIPGTNTSIKVHGYAKMDVIHQTRLRAGTGAIDSNTDFSDIPLKGTPTFNRGGELVMTLRETRLDVDTETVTGFGTVGSRVEGDFYGGSSAFRLRKAYLTIKNPVHELLIGQERTTFADPDATGDAETLDFGGIIGTPGGRVPMVRYTGNASPLCKVIFALENPDTSYMNAQLSNSDGDLITVNPDTAKFTVQKMPDVVAAFRFGNADSHLGIRGTITEFRIKDGAFNSRKQGWGIAQNGRYTFSNKDQISYDVTYGPGMGGSWMTGGSGAAYNPSTLTRNNQTFVRGFFLQRSLGLSFAFKHNWTDTLRSTIGLGYLREYNKSFMKVSQTNKRLRDIHVNLIESPFKNFDIGLEYGYGERTVEAVSNTGYSKSGSVQRVQFSAKYKF